MSPRSFSSPSPYESGIWGTPERPCPSERTLAAHLDGELDEARARALEAHLDACPACAYDHRRLEGLSGLLRDWEARTGRVEPPARLEARILRQVSVEGGALRRESARAARRLWAAAAAALVAVALGVGLGWRAPEADEGPGEVWTPPSLAAAFTPEGASIPVPPLPPRGPGLLGLEAPALDAARGRLLSAKPSPFDSSVLSDPAAVDAFVRWLPAVEVERRIGEEVCLYDGRALPTWALPEYERLRRWGAWVEERERRLAEADTRDPSRAGLALPDLLPFGDAAALPAFLRGAPSASEAAAPGHGGLLLRALPAREAPSTAPAKEPAVLDLPAAVRAGKARLVPDERGDRLDVGILVSSADAPVLVPTGELIEGGAGDRVVAEGAWLAPSPDPYVVRLPCRPVSRAAGAPGVAPVPAGALAGPSLRALLARGEDAQAVLSLVDAQLRDAGLSGPEGARATSLLALYSPSETSVWSPFERARALSGALGDGAAGFVASDLDGRFQGLERVDLPPLAARHVLARLLEGYLAEARTRSSADAPRLGVHAETVLGRLLERPPRLSPRKAPASAGRTLSGEEAGTGLLFEGIAGPRDRVPLLSGLVPEYR